jgi:hypothetical protein
MRTTVIPAQVTTVEDTIAGNLNFTQIVLLVSSLFVNTFVYTLLAPRLSFSPYKLAIITLIFLGFITLALRIKGRLVMQWVEILASYFLRPHIYVFNKNSLTNRYVAVVKELRSKAHPKRVEQKESPQVETPNFDYESILRDTNLNLQFKGSSVVVVKNYDQA